MGIILDNGQFKKIVAILNQTEYTISTIVLNNH